MHNNAKIIVRNIILYYDIGKMLGVKESYRLIIYVEFTMHLNVSLT